MKIRLFSALLAVMFGLFFTSCDKETGSSESKKEVVVVFLPNALGDGSYFDSILKGVMQFLEKKDNYESRIIVPATLEEGEQSFKSFLPDRKERIILLAGSDYQSVVDKYPSELASKTCEVVLLESKKETPLLKTCYLSLYGASYLSGAILSDHFENLAVITANQYETSVNDGMKGVVAGFSEHMHSGAEVENFFLSESKSGGFSNSAEAYILADSLYKDYDVIFPLIGSSKSGVYKSARENIINSKWMVGMDVDDSGNGILVPCSVIKRMDLLMESILNQWEEGKDIDHHSVYGLDSDYIDLIVDDDFSANKDKYKQEAVEKEKLYLNNN